jgi:hypothetical protein
LHLEVGMNDWMVEKLDRERRNSIRKDVAHIHGAQRADRTQTRPFLFRLGSGLINLGRSLRKRSGPRRKRSWTVQPDLSAEQS